MAGCRCCACSQDACLWQQQGSWSGCLQQDWAVSSELCVPAVGHKRDRRKMRVLNRGMLLMLCLAAEYHG
jgi:hypothetical protein